jgi:hypothetical protein
MSRKSKLAKLLSEKEHYEYETTVEDCQKWFNILNRELFDNSLPKVDDIDIRWRRGAYAWYDYDETKPGTGEVRLLMNKRYKSKQFFVEVLAHEMVHHYQYIYNEEMGHGSSFFKWSGKFNQKGLSLSEVY